MSKPAFPTVPNARLTSDFGWRIHPITGERSFHTGKDFAPPVAGQTGIPIYATQDGKVRRAQFDDSMGNYVYLEHTKDTYTSVYMHMSLLRTSVGARVRKGQQIGVMGTTGSSTGVHLHFMISKSYPPVHSDQANLVDPDDYLDGAGGTTLVPICGNRYLKMSEMTNNAEYFYIYMDSKGWTKNAVAGMLGNMQTESTINPCLWQNKESYDDNPYSVVPKQGYGLVQWTPFSNMTRWARDNGLKYNDMDTQMQRINYEIENGIQWIKTSGYPLSFKDFKTSTETPEYLAQAFLKNYERPRDQNQPDRSTQARYWFDNLTGEGSITPGEPGEPDDTKKKYLVSQLRWTHHRRR